MIPVITPGFELSEESTSQAARGASKKRHLLERADESEVASGRGSTAA